MVIKTNSHSRSNLYQIHLRNNRKMKQNQLDGCKVKIFENQDEFDILTKDSVWNIEKRTLKKRKK